MAMLRFNAGKAPLSLVPSTFFEAIFNNAYDLGRPMPTKLIWQVGEVLEFGAKKYSAHNWRKGGSWSSVLNSALRHLVHMIDGRRIDPESGLSEAGHLGCNIAFLLEFVHTANGDDDRFPVFWAAELEHDPEPTLTYVLDALLRFRDGGNFDLLRDAAYELARWVEMQTDESEPAAPPSIDQADIGTVTVAGIGSEHPDVVHTDPSTGVSFIRLPFRFPSFLQARSEVVFDGAKMTKH